MHWQWFGVVFRACCQREGKTSAASSSMMLTDGNLRVANLASSDAEPIPFGSSHHLGFHASALFAFTHSPPSPHTAHIVVPVGKVSVVVAQHTIINNNEARLIIHQPARSVWALSRQWRIVSTILLTQFWISQRQASLTARAQASVLKMTKNADAVTTRQPVMMVVIGPGVLHLFVLDFFHSPRRTRALRGLRFVASILWIYKYAMFFF